MARKINKKKIVGTCPVGMRKAVCPSIKNTRQIRIKLLKLQRQNNVDQNQVNGLRLSLKEKKKQGIAVDCDTCKYNTTAPTVAPAAK
ncbi:MAG TPA: hypothetical protein ACFYD7_10325 [Candidatus Wujingus californicus]|uniref:hypothetical protein n=1 Tax=Candidatus Wujingus californicus TaxID=3367618 RepID=UPI001D3F2D62|nr:hypothetical protein [Planctomycetota bacterium]MDO8131714.1 hypothetical protein [Candidatus Brocadiales bacterium]